MAAHPRQKRDRIERIIRFPHPIYARLKKVAERNRGQRTPKSWSRWTPTWNAKKRTTRNDRHPTRDRRRNRRDATRIEIPDLSHLPTPDLFAKLLVAQSNAQTVEKAGRNQAQNYRYARAEDVIAEAQRALHEANLVGYMEPTGDPDEQAIESSGGTGGLFVRLRARLVIVDPDDGARLTIPAFGTGVDYPGDKATYKALTGAAKYAYAAALGIPFGDDPEDEAVAKDRKPAAGARAQADEPATPAQKRAITTILRRNGVSDAAMKSIVDHHGGDPLTKAGASTILDRIAGDKSAEATLEEIGRMIAELPGDKVPTDIPADDADLPPAERPTTPAPTSNSRCWKTAWTRSPTTNDAADRRRTGRSRTAVAGPRSEADRRPRIRRSADRRRRPHGAATCPA